MHPLRLALLALLLLAVFSTEYAEGSPQASIEDIDPQVINLDVLPEVVDWRNTSYIYENHNSFTPSNHTWTHNYTEPGDDWGMPNPTWNLSQGQAEQDIDRNQIWGPALNCEGGSGSNSEFCMYYDGGSGSLFTENYDVSDLPYSTSLYLRHRYNFDYYAGYTPYNGGNVKISTDNGTTWSLLYPDGGYPGTIYDEVDYGNPLYGQEGFVHCGSCPGSGTAADNQDEWITTTFDLRPYFYTGNVKFQFIFGIYNYQWPGDGEHWYIDEFSIAQSPEKMYFLGNASDIDGNITDYQWNSTIDGNFGNTENLTFILNGFQRLSIGNHTISFRAQNEEGNWSDEDYSWLLIFRNPGIEWIDVPENFSNDVSPFIEFNITTPVNFSTRCKLDEGGWYDCGLTNNFTNLTEGEHSFAVNATDEFGYYNLSYLNWTIDVTPPIVNIVEGPEFIVRYDSYVNITIQSNESNLTLECRLYLNGNILANQCYESGASVDAAIGEEGELEYWIRATDNADNTGNWSQWKWNQINHYIDSIFGSSYRNQSLSFHGYSSNVVDCNRSFSWDSNKDGIIGTTQNFTTTNLTLGIHNITFTTSYSCNGEIWDFEEDAWSSINVINNPPNVDYSVSETSIRQYRPLSVSCSASDFDGYVVKYRWALVNSSDRQNISKDFVLYEGENPNITFSNITVGSHWITCRAFDNDGDWNWVETITSIYIFNNTKPQADIEEIVPYLAEYGRSVAFYGSASDDNFTIEEYEWSSNVDGTLSNTPNFTTSSLSAGWHTISFRVRDPEGLWSNNSNRNLYVNIIPTAYAGENVSTTPNVPIQFNGQGTDEDGEIVLYEWDFDGDGIYDWADEFNGRELNLYNNAGTYTAVLRVTDNDGSTSTDEVTVIVTEKDVVIDLGDGEIDLDNGTIELENGTVDLVETDEGLPSIGIMAAITSIGLIAVFRRK